MEQTTKSSSGQALNFQNPMKAPNRSSPSSDERFGLWMLVGRGNRNKAWKKPTATAGGVDRAAGQRDSKKLEQRATDSRFSVLAQMAEEETLGTLERRRKVWVPVKSNSEHGLPSAKRGVEIEVHRALAEERMTTGRKLGENGLLQIQEAADLNEEEGAVYVSHGEGDVALKIKGSARGFNGAKGTGLGIYYNGKSPKNLSGPTVRKEKESMGHKILNSSGFNGSEVKGAMVGAVGRRTHKIVGGNINQVGSKNILINYDEEGSKINGMLLLEGPGRVDETNSDDFLKEKFERSIGHKIDNLTDLEEDAGDDFNFMDIQEQGSYEAEEQGGSDQDYPMIG